LCFSMELRYKERLMAMAASHMGFNLENFLLLHPAGALATLK
jgi:hypothetical protein